MKFEINSKVKIPRNACLSIFFLVFGQWISCVHSKESLEFIINILFKSAR